VANSAANGCFTIAATRKAQAGVLSLAISPGVLCRATRSAMAGSTRPSTAYFCSCAMSRAAAIATLKTYWVLARPRVCNTFSQVSISDMTKAWIASGVV
jgi:hypothetical protein